jgi:glycosyltransferase involved in cell wall biosynthesis
LVFSTLENRAIRAHHHVVAISNSLRIAAIRARVPPSKCSVIENWAPLDDLPPRCRANAWARAHNLVDETVFLYAGTLGLKHRPELLVTLARGLRDCGVVVVVSEGPGAEIVASTAAAERLPNLRVMPFQPFADLPDVLGAADVLVVLLEPSAGAFSVPSKVLTYLCAGKPLLAFVPPENLAAVVVAERAEAGIVVTEEDMFVESALRLARDADLRERLGRSGRDYAELNFDIDRIASEFESLMLSTSDMPDVELDKCSSS